VSGGGTGIGKATAAAFAHGGDAVLILGRRREVLERAAAEINAAVGGERVHWQAADLRDPAAVSKLRFPATVDVLVNNAGGAGHTDSETLETLADSVRAAFEQNLLTAALLTAAIGRRLRRPGGRVINVSSIAALRGGGVSYSAAKGALISWSHTIASELGPDGITVNVVAPGYVTDTEFFGDSMTEQRHTDLVEATLVGRAGVPDDVASAILYLASAEAGYVTSQVLQVNGGMLVGRG
jgi:3-oxoacyl-[acyl-carrier protein] reductase